MSTIVYQPQPIVNSASIPIPANTLCKALEFVNETPNLMIVSLSGQFGQFIMQPYTTRYKNIPGFGNGEVNVFLLATMNGSGQAPLNLFGLISYGPEDPDQADFVIQSDRLNSIGNPASVGTANSSVINDGNPVQNIVEATLQGSSGSNVLIKNDGTMQLAEYVSSVFNILLKINPGAATALLLGLAGRTVEILGDLKIDGALNTAGVNVFGVLQSATGGSVKADILNAGANLPGAGLGVSAAKDLLDYNGTNMRLRASGGVIATCGGVDQFQVNSGGIYVTAGKIGQSAVGDILDASLPGLFAKGSSGGTFTYQPYNGSTGWTRLAESHGTTGAIAPNATLTVTHNLKVNGVAQTPDNIQVTPVGTATSTATWTALNRTSTTFQIYNSNSGVTQTFDWKCEKY